jgi:hypothetical protein
MGQLYWFQLPLIIFGILSIFLKKNRREKIFFGIIPLLLYPTGSMFTGLTPQASRSVMGVVPLTLLSAVGLSWLINIFSKLSKRLVYIFSLGFGIVILASFLNFNQFYLKYPQYSSDFWGWQYGAKPIMKYFLDHVNEYDELLIPGDFNVAEAFPMFYDYQELCQDKCFIGGLKQWDEQKKQLLAVSTETYDNEIKNFCVEFLVHKKIYYPNKKTAFFIGECKQ